LRVPLPTSILFGSFAGVRCWPFSSAKLPLAAIYDESAAIRASKKSSAR
jgi:hypothetical protein